MWSFGVLVIDKLEIEKYKNIAFNQTKIKYIKKSIL